MMDQTLKPCPFCGGRAEIVKKEIYLDYGYRVDCTQCGTKSNVVLVNHPKFTYNGLDESTRYTNDQAQRVVAEAWNRRAYVSDKTDQEASECR